MIRAAFPLDRRRNARMSPATAISAASPSAARGDQSCALSCASVPATETVRGSPRGRSGDSCSCRKGDPGFAASRRAALADSTSLRSPRSAAGPASAWTTVFCGDLIERAVGSIAPRCTWDASTTLAPAVGASATAGASAECSVATGAGRAAVAVAAAGVASVTGGAVSTCADSAAAGEATSATGADPAATVATRGGSKVKGST
jgi:hypothetical protein